MAATHKSSVLMRVLAESLSLRTGLAAASGVDASGNPTIVLGTGAAGSESAFLRLKQDYDPALEENGIGQVQRRYGPHVAQLVIENGLTGTGGTGDTQILPLATISKIVFELSRIGTKVQIYEVANGTAPSVSGIASANLKVTLDSLWQPLTSTI